MAEEAVSTVEHAGVTISSTDDAKALSEALVAKDAERAEAAGEEPDGDPVSKAASELGKRGGKAAAKAAEKRRAESAKEPPAEPAEAKPAEAAGEAEPAEKDTDSEKGDEKGDEHRSRARQRVEEATRAAAAARREAEEARREAAELRERLRSAPEPPKSDGGGRQAAAEKPAGKPDPGEFETYEQYLDARDTWNRQEWQRESEERTRTQQKQERVGSIVTTFRDRIKAEGPTFLTEEVSDDVRSLRPTFTLTPNETPTGHHFLADALLLRSEHAPALMRHLTEHPRDFERIAALTSPYEVAYQVGMLVARLEGATAGDRPGDERPASKPVSKAPPPVRPVTGEPSAASIAYREGMSLDEYAAARRPRATAR